MPVSRDNVMGVSRNWLQMIFLSGDMCRTQHVDPLTWADMRTSMCDRRIVLRLEQGFTTDDMDRDGYVDAATWIRRQTS